MIAKKGQPAPGPFRVSGRSFHPTGNTSFRYIEAQHEQFTVDAWSTPGWVFCHDAEDHIANFLRQAVSTDLFFHLGDQAPVKSKSGTMPADHRFRSDQHQRLLPSTPKTTGEYSEDFVNRSNPGSGMLALQHGQLLPEGEIFHEQASMRLQAAGEQAQP